MMRNQAYQDSYSPARRAIAQTVLQSPLANALRDYDRASLQALADGTSKESYSFLSLEFRRADSNANLYVNAEPVYGFRDQRRDSEGNEWMEYKLSTQVSWPGHGSSTAGIALARLEFYRELALLAATIEAEHVQPIYKMTRTAQEIAVQAEKAAAEKRWAALKDYARAQGHGLRTGGKSRYYDVANNQGLVGVEPGTYEVTLGTSPLTRTYCIEIGTNGNVRIKRVA